MKKFLYYTLVTCVHAIATIAIIYVFLPTAQWYFNAKPLWGVDFYYTASLVTLLKQNLILPNLAWGYAWFTGWPVLSNYPLLHYYLIIPFTNYFPIIDAVKMWMVVSLGLYFVGMYAVFYLLSRNFAVSFVLAIAGIFSVGVYGTLMWGGSLPSHATQAFLPWVLLFVIAYLKYAKKRFLFLAGIIAGLAILAHPQVVIAYIYPFSSLLFLFSFGTMKFFARLKALFVFLTISFIIGLPLLYSSMGGALQSLVVTDAQKVASSTAQTPSDTLQAIVEFHKAQPLRIYSDTNTTIFIILAVSLVLFIVSLIFKGRVSRFFVVFPFIVLALFSVTYVWMFAYGISIYHGGWYRLFWAVPLWVGLLAAACWGEWQSLVSAIIKNRYISLVLYVIVSTVILVLGTQSVYYYAEGIQDKIVLRSTPSSAYPDILNINTSSSEREQLKKTMLPAWIDGDNTQYRIYSGDQTFNIWWNSLYKMPLTRGYLDPPVTAKQRGFFFLLDTALSQDTVTGEDQMVTSFKYPAQVAANNTLYLVDWYAIKYLHAGPTVAGFTALPKSFNNPEHIKQTQKLNFNDAKYNKGDMTLQYYEVKDEFVSPILTGSNASTVGIVATDSGYETIVRALADMNFSSKQVIPVKLGQYIDKLNMNDLIVMDSLIVYDYNYSDKGNAYSLLNTYLKKGRNIFIDTGVDVKEANANDTLPEVFPIDKSERKSMGLEWKLEAGDPLVTSGIDFSKFDPPIFNDAPWNISYPPATEDIREDTTVILKNQGIPVIMSHNVAAGKVYWSGINLPYHTIRNNNQEELKFFKNILEKLLEGRSNTETPSYEVKFLTPQNREITTKGARGVLFKEQAYPGWTAKLENASTKSKLKVFKVGPAYPGFIYVQLPEELQGQEAKVVFTYSGSSSGFVYMILAIIAVVLLAEEALLGGIIIGRLRRIIWKRANVRINRWWNKEDEDI